MPIQPVWKSWFRSRSAVPNEAGLVQPDGTTISVDPVTGIISAAAGPGAAVTAVTGTPPIASSGGLTPAISIALATSLAVGAVKPDGTTITVDGAGTLSTTAGLQVKTLNISDAQIRGMFAAPVLFIPHPGAGKVIRIVSWSVEAIFGGNAFAGGGNIGIFYGSVSPPVTTAGNVILAAFLTTFAANQLAFSSIAGAQGALSTVVLDTGIFISNLAAPFTGGNGASMTVTCLYYISDVFQ